MWKNIEETISENSVCFTSSCRDNDFLCEVLITKKVNQYIINCASHLQFAMHYKTLCGTSVSPILSFHRSSGFKGQDIIGFLGAGAVGIFAERRVWCYIICNLFKFYCFILSLTHTYRLYFGALGLNNIKKVKQLFRRKSPDLKKNLENKYV